MWGNSKDVNAVNTVNTVEEATDLLVEKVCESKIYNDYLVEKRRVENDPECVEKIRRYRKLSAELQKMSDEERIYNGDRIEQELDDITSDARVLDYVQAEVDFARAFQKIMSKITDAIDMID